ncbi:MAG: hypothetical protein AMXMBFR68_03610 [Ignavibacteria bacterium]
MQDYTSIGDLTPHGITPISTDDLKCRSQTSFEGSSQIMGNSPNLHCSFLLWKPTSDPTLSCIL